MGDTMAGHIIPSSSKTAAEIDHAAGHNTSDHVASNTTAEGVQEPTNDISDSGVIQSQDGIAVVNDPGTGHQLTEANTAAMDIPHSPLITPLPAESDLAASIAGSIGRTLTPVTDTAVKAPEVIENLDSTPPTPFRVKPMGPLPNAKVLIPLYMYPVSNSTWGPLLQAIERNPHHDFVIVINPNSGPGGHPLPCNDYLREIPKLNKYPNVQTVGYIKIDWCRRPLSGTFSDIETYAGWSLSGWLGTYVEGVFVDETPNHFSEERAEYLHAVRKYIRAIAGFGDRRLIMENPGTPPDHRLTWFADCKPDVIFTCEEPYERYIGHEVQNHLSEVHYDQPCSGYMISGVPRDQVGQFTKALRWRAAYVFATDTVDDFYEKFGEGWLDYIGALEKSVTR